jgi:hypothetical protein
VINRRGFLGALLVAPIASQIPASMLEFGVAGIEVAAVPITGSAVFTSGAIARLLQEGIHKVFTEAYADYPAEWPQIFSQSPKEFPGTPRKRLW